MKVGNKIAKKNDTLTAKDDLLKLQLAVEKGFDSVKIWIVGTSVGVVGLIFCLLNSLWLNNVI